MHIKRFNENNNNQDTIHTKKDDDKIKTFVYIMNSRTPFNRRITDDRATADYWDYEDKQINNFIDNNHINNLEMFETIIRLNLNGLSALNEYFNRWLKTTNGKYNTWQIKSLKDTMKIRKEQLKKNETY